MTSHRLRLVGVCVALSVVVSGCSRPQDKVLETATIRTAPPATEPPPTIATTPPEPTTTTPIATSTSVGPTTVMNDSEAIRTAAETLFRVVMEQKTSTLDPAPLRSLTTDDFYTFEADSFAETKATTKYERRGSIKETKIGQITKLSANKAIVVVCDRNNTQLWDSIGTADPNDDKLIDDSTATFGYLVTVVKEEGTWLIADLNDEDSGVC
jgi:hypothetical protein